MNKDSKGNSGVARVWLRRGRKLLKILRNRSALALIKLSEPFFYMGNSRSAETRAALASAHGKDALLVTVAFKKADLVEIQAKLLKRHFLDSYTHVVVDNSPDEVSRSAIRLACIRAGSHYIALPRNPAKHGSFSHGIALNWAYRNLSRFASVEYFGFLDHDIFLYEDVSYREVVLRQGSFGHFQRAGKFFFYWAGLSFFSSKFFRNGSPDFMPMVIDGVYLDTGGGNWKRYYSEMVSSEMAVFDIYDICAANPSLMFDRQNRSETQQEASFTIFDREWVHLVNGSNWAGVDMETKTQNLVKFLGVPQP